MCLGMGRRAHRGRYAQIHFGVQEGGHHGLSVPRPATYLSSTFGDEGSPHPSLAGTAGAQDSGNGAALFPSCAGAVTECGHAFGWGYC